MNKYNQSYFLPVSILFSDIIPENAHDFVDEPDDYLLVICDAVERFYPSIANAFSERIVISSSNSNYPALKNLEAIKLPAKKHIIGIGGGSVLDTAKALFAKKISNDDVLLADLLKNPALLDHAQTERQAHELVLVPTTFGTSSEITKWGTIWDWEKKIKYSLSHELLFADRALVFPELAATLPARVIAETGLDVFSHGLESYWNKSSNFMTRHFALESMRLCLEFLPGVVQKEDDPIGRSQVARASVYAGMSFSQTRTATAHAISYPLTLFHGISHGIACSITLGELFEEVFEDHQVLLQPVLSLIQGIYGTSDASFQTCFLKFYKDCMISPKLRDHGVAKSDLPSIADNSYHEGRSGNMVSDIDKNGILKILHNVF